MSVSIYPMVSDSQDGKNSYINLIAVHFKKMSFYRKDWSIQDILVFEAFLVLSRAFGGYDFFHQMRFLKDKTRLTKYHIRKSLDKFEELGFISVNRNGKFRSNIYRVNYDVIKDNLDEIYNFGTLSERDIKPFKHLMREFFDYYQEYHSELNQYHDRKSGEIPNSYYKDKYGPLECVEKELVYLTKEEMFSPEFIAEQEALIALEENDD